MAQPIPATLRHWSDRAYLTATACPGGGTLTRANVAENLQKLEPTFVHRLAAANREARAAGIPVCIFSAYRAPATGVGGFADKFESAHAYGLAVDQGGLDGPGSEAAISYHKIAARHGIYGPYGPNNRAEFNHFEPTRIKTVAEHAPLRSTITAAGPKNVERMWMVASLVIEEPGLTVSVSGQRRAHRGNGEIHHHRHHRHHYRTRVAHA